MALCTSPLLLFGCDRSEDKTAQALRSLFPKEGYFEPLDSVEVDLGVQGNTYRISWKHEYSGTYSLGLTIGNPPSINAGTVTFDGVLYIRVLSGETEVFSKETNLSTAPLFVRGPGLPGGVTLWYFEVPEQLPFDERIICEVQVVKSDLVFQVRHKPIELYAVKEPDL